MNGDLNFHIGDKVVYPNHGVGVIEQISSRSIGATVEKFYLLNIKASSLKVMVPCNNVGSVGIRRVVRNGEVQKILDFLSIGEDLSTADWKDRFRENSDRMRTGSLFEVAGVLKSLIALHQAKPLPRHRMATFGSAPAEGWCVSTAPRWSSSIVKIPPPSARTASSACSFKRAAISGSEPKAAAWCATGGGLSGGSPARKAYLMASCAPSSRIAVGSSGWEPMPACFVCRAIACRVWMDVRACPRWPCTTSARIAAAGCGSADLRC